MKAILTIFLASLCVDAFSQNVYNEHIDPDHRLDNLNSFNLKICFLASSSMNFGIVRDVSDVKSCRYFANGDQKCVSGNGVNLDSFVSLPTKIDFENALRTRLNFISAKEDSAVMSFKTINDSITVIEKKINFDQKFTYTFDSKTRDLLQMENNAKKEGGRYTSVLRYLGYQNINGILVPRQITSTIDFISGHLMYAIKAKLEYEDVSFKK